MLNMVKRARGHFVTFIEIPMHLFRSIYGHISMLLTEASKMWCSETLQSNRVHYLNVNGMTILGVGVGIGGEGYYS